MNDKETLLIEIGTEELPPKSLQLLSNAFKENIQQGLDKQHFTHDEIMAYATPRRLAVSIKNLISKQPDKLVEKKGPPLTAAYNSQGEPTKALLGFVESAGVPLEQLEKIVTEKGTWLVCRVKQPGKMLQDVIVDILTTAIEQLPIAKRMRWGNLPIAFVRPIHWVVLLYGSKLINVEVLGKKTQNESYGHRFHHPEAFSIPHASMYVEYLYERGKVIADFQKRREKIKEQVLRCGKELGGTAIIPDNLLNEVTALVEWPHALTGTFEKQFLDIPAESLISSMHDHQKYFHVIDQQHNLMPYFIFVSNIDSLDEEKVIEGNERVMRARLSDADFFYQTDLKHSLESYAEKLKQVVFQAQLGNLFEKSTRIANLALFISHQIGSCQEYAERAGQLCKADLMSDMVGEFPELQGIMGSYYANHAHEPIEVATAIKEHYLPRFAGDDLPATKTGCTVAIADRIDTLVGIFGINKPPTGEKDPFGLRRAALSLLRIIIEKGFSVDLMVLLNFSYQQYQHTLPNPNTVNEACDFILERLKTWYLEKGITANVFAAVLAKRPTSPFDFQQRILAINLFLQRPEALSLAAANKRVSKLLIKEGKAAINRHIHENLLVEEAEKLLAIGLQQKAVILKPLFQESKYNEALAELSTLKEPIDRFFDEVMVMVEDEKIRNNRLALLANLRDLFLHVADMSLL